MVNIKPVSANTIFIDLNKHQLVYINTEKNQYVQYPIVAPKIENRKFYDGKYNFNIIDIQYKPRQLTYNGKILSSTDSFNILGDFAIPFHKHLNSKRHCSIHGAAKPEDIGKNLSGCCIRMLNSDIINLVTKYIDFNTKVKLKIK